eukprot:9157799-Pyramimonas_sp.AAC.1
MHCDALQRVALHSIALRCFVTHDSALLGAGHPSHCVGTVRGREYRSAARFVVQHEGNRWMWLKRIKPNVTSVIIVTPAST